MHEYSIVRDLLDRVEAEAAAHGASVVHSLRLRIGERSGVEIELLRSAYEMFRERSPCAAADLEISSVTARWGCPGCGKELEKGERLQCPECGSPARLLSGDEIVLERIEMEVA